MKKRIYVFCAIFTVACLIYLYNIEYDDYDSSKYPGIFVLKVYNKADTIYYTQPLEDIYMLLNMKIIDLSTCKDAIFKSMVSHSAIEVDSVLFNKLNKKKIKVVKEVQDIYINGGIYAVLDHYMKKNNALKDLNNNEISIETKKYIFYLAYLNNIYFDYMYILGDEYIDFIYSLKEPVYKKLVNYRDSIQERQ